MIVYATSSARIGAFRRRTRSRHWLGIGLLVLGVVTGAPHAVAGLRVVAPASVAPDGRDYGFMWWAYGWRGEKVRCYQTGYYGVAEDVGKTSLRNLGFIKNPLKYSVAVCQANDVVFSLPAPLLKLSVTAGGTPYTCQSGGNPRLIASGRFVQWSDSEGLSFVDAAGKALPARGRLEYVVWPDRLAVILEVTATENLPQANCAISCRAGERLIEQASPRGDWAKGTVHTIHAVLWALRPDVPDAKDIVAFPGCPPQETPKVRYDPARGSYRIDLPARPPAAPDQPHLERVPLRLTNPGLTPRVIRLDFAKEPEVPGMTGLVPMLRDPAGNPTGIPVQISKNWHHKDEPLLHQGNWLHSFTMLRLPPQSMVDLEYALAFNFWGTAPLASHAQLCLIGWGTDQLWDEAALGSWGESICYDPDVNLARSMIDDCRPLMVTNMKSGNGKWGWTNNVGGGDFLVYSTDQGKQWLSRMRTAYLSCGPNLTDVIYAGVSADGAIAATIHVQSARTDDINRAYHRFRYDVLKPTKFNRLVFYQLGADSYNDHSFNKIARGNETGLLEEWSPAKGTLDHAGIACPGAVPWFSLHEGSARAGESGAWANRGLVIRAWKAKLGGHDAPPLATINGTGNGNTPSNNVELVAPADLKELQPGDFVEGTVEYLVVPQFAKDYYGPNEGLRESLKSGENTWQPVHRLAVSGRLAATAARGQVRQACPLVVDLDPASRSAEIDITGGLAYVPVTFAGLPNASGWSLYSEKAGRKTKVDQSVLGHDFWQVDRDDNGKYRMTFNVLIEAPTGEPARTKLSFHAD